PRANLRPVELRQTERGQARLPNPEVNELARSLFALKAYPAEDHNSTVIISGSGRWACPRSWAGNNLSPGTYCQAAKKLALQSSFCIYSAARLTRNCFTPS